MEFNTTHHFFSSNAARLDSIDDESIQLVVTSPPYPMIGMWDDQFRQQNDQIQLALDNGEGALSFELMHQELDKVWEEMYRVLANGGFMCINIGDAARNIDGNFSLFSNHSRIIQYLTRIGFHNLPNILWRKPTNAPTKFMGSGTYPAGAYVTLEHEYILIFRKGLKRNFKSDSDQARRRRSSIFWTERNSWFSDLWQLKGTGQNTANDEVRKRSAAYPIDIPFRIINMYSLQEDMILDPFAGSGTSSFAAMAAGRNSIAVDVEPSMVNYLKDRLSRALESSPDKLQQTRLLSQKAETESIAPGAYKYMNKFYDFPVKTRQEQELILSAIESFERLNNHFSLRHTELRLP